MDYQIVENYARVFIYKSGSVNFFPLHLQIYHDSQPKVLGNILIDDAESTADFLRELGVNAVANFSSKEVPSEAPPFSFESCTNVDLVKFLEEWLSEDLMKPTSNDVTLIVLDVSLEEIKQRLSKLLNNCSES